ncbi:hypothetical protein [Eisenbergiella porci]|nr:hypothetical protein [Eisenbergiella porci]
MEKCGKNRVSLREMSVNTPKSVKSKVCIMGDIIARNEYRIGAR